jgi:hypothetical protein
MAIFHEAQITINGKPLTIGESMTIRVACTAFLHELNDPETNDSLGPIAVSYEANLRVILALIKGAK